MSKNDHVFSHSSYRNFLPPVEIIYFPFLMDDQFKKAPVKKAKSEWSKKSKKKPKKTGDN
jgi:hypothetical protein